MSPPTLPAELPENEQAIKMTLVYELIWKPPPVDVTVFDDMVQEIMSKFADCTLDPRILRPPPDALAVFDEMMQDTIVMFAVSM